MLTGLAVMGIVVWALWILLETWRDRVLRILVLLSAGSAGTVILAWTPVPGTLAAWWPAVWGLCPLGFALGRTLAGRVSFPAQLEWAMGPVDAVAVLVTHLVSRRGPARPASEAAFPAHSGMEALQLVQELGSRSVDEVMISRSEMDALEADATVADWVERMAADQRRRFPVYRGHQDELLGVVSLRELLNSRSPRQQVGSFVRPVSFVPGTKKCDELLRQLWRSGEDMAVVVDEYGGVSGLVTREDLLEILVGNLLEEPGQDAARLLRIDRRTLLADGHYRIADFNEKFAAGLPEGEYETLSGLFLERLGRIPQTGERLSLNDVVLEVAARDDRRIQSIRVRLAGSRKPRSTQRTGTETN